MCDVMANDPYVLFIGNLNCTQCYKEMLLAGNKEIEKYAIPDESRSEYEKLRTEFEQKYPNEVKQFKKIRPTDCTIS